MIIQLNPSKWFGVGTRVTLPAARYDHAAEAAKFLDTTRHDGVDLMSKAAKAEEKQMSFLKHVGNFFRSVLHIGEEVAMVASPIIKVAFPDVSPLFNSAIGLAIAAEATVAGATGNGPQKLAQVVTGINPLIDKFVADNNLGSWASADRAKFASAIADALNLIPAPLAGAAVVVKQPVAGTIGG